MRKLEFIDLVRKMREAQIKFERISIPGNLRARRDYERRVDEALAPTICSAEELTSCCPSTQP